MSERAIDPQTTEQEIADKLERIRRHQGAGRFAEASVLIEELLAQKGEMPRLLHLKGLNRVMSGDMEGGEALIREGLKGAPEDPIQNVDLGVILARTNRLDEAVGHFRTAVEVAPNFEMAHSNLGGALVLQKAYREAIGHLERAIALEGNLFDAHTNLGTAYMSVNQAGKAVDVLYKALSIDPLSVRAHIQLSAALYRNERHDTAEHHARKALELAPDAAEAYLHLGNALGSAGKLDEAAEALLKVAGAPPVGLAALTRLVHMRKTREDAPELALLAQYAGQEDTLTQESRASLHFAYGKALDDLKRHDEAFAHFALANKETAEMYPFNAELYAARGAGLRALATPALLSRCAGGGVSEIAPIFITGMPRSGTTLMDQMFSRHPRVTAGGELRALPAALQANTRLRAALEERIDAAELTADDFSRLGEDYMDGVRAEGIRSEYVSDKMPSNYLYAGLVALALPRAKVLFMRRHPLDCLLSNYFQNFGQNQPASSGFANLAVTYREFDRMVHYWSEVIPDRVRVVNYEDVVADAEGQMRGILEFVGLEWDAKVLDHRGSSRQVNTASLAQVREPIYTRAVARWEKYAPHLGPLANELRAYLSPEDLAKCGVA